VAYTEAQRQLVGLERRLVAYTEARRQLVGLERRLVVYTEARRQLVADWLARWTVNPVAMARLWHTTRRRTVLSLPFCRYRFFVLPSPHMQEFESTRQCLSPLSRHVSACLPLVDTSVPVSP